MITDYADKLHLYGDLQEYADMVLAFIEKQKKENLPAGRYDLENGVFASVQSYTTRPLEGSQMESHKKYCDLQYLIEGKEKIYWASLRNLTVENDMTPVILFFMWLVHGRGIRYWSRECSASMHRMTDTCQELQQTSRHLRRKLCLRFQ